MIRTTGTYRVQTGGGEAVRVFVPAALPPADPPLAIDTRLTELHDRAIEALGRLDFAGTIVPSSEWFLYGFVRKEAVLTSEIEGTQATLQDMVTFEATGHADRPDDVEEVCNYVDALTFALDELRNPQGLPLSVRLLCESHRRLMRGVRGHDKSPGEIRRSQNWIGGTRPGNAKFVPPPPEMVLELLGDLERWMHSEDSLPPLIKAGLAHVQFESIHPFLDGNGRIGRLMIALLLEHWGVLQRPLLYLSVALKRRQQQYYDALSAVRTKGDWEGWTAFFLECVTEAAIDGLRVAEGIGKLLTEDRARLMEEPSATMQSVRLLDMLPSHPVITTSRAMDLLSVSKPTALKSIALLESLGVLHEATGRQRDRVHVYRRYLELLQG